MAGMTTLSGPGRRGQGEPRSLDLRAVASSLRRYWPPVLAALLTAAGPAAADGPGRAVVITPVALAAAPPLATVTPVAPAPGRMMTADHPLPSTINGRWRGPSPNAPPAASVLQGWAGPLAMPSPILDFEGNGIGLPGFVMTFAPPDTEGDVGPDHYIQWVNGMFAIWNKAGNKLYGPAAGTTLFAGLAPNHCATYVVDPQVMYDAIADRWVLSAGSLIPPGFEQCVAVSMTNDPVNGGWYTWAFDYGSSYNDYAKGGVWPDGYYMTYNMFPASGVGYLGAEVCAFDRVRMLAGDPAAPQQCFGPDPNYGSLLPAHLNLGGTQLPPPGSPNYVMALGTSGQLLLWPFHVDWTTPANSTFPFDSPTTITVAAFTLPCNGTGAVCVPQLGTPQTLDTLGDRLMWRLNYRNFGTHESLVANHSIDTGSNAPTGVRWYEIRSPGASPVAFQEGTFAPDSSWRWMGSVGLDVNGDIAVGYSVSSAAMNPSIRYAGRLWSDPPGTLPQAEATLQAGTGSQTVPLNRWGDYSTVSVDPTDGCTFWYTQQYLAANGTFNWRTRIGSFRFPGCTNVCPAIAGALASSGAICPGGSATVTVTVSGGRPPYVVTLDNGGGSQSGPGPAFTFTVSPPATTTYGVAYLTDDNGCLGSGTGSAVVTVNAAPSIAAQPVDAVACAGGGATFLVSASGSGLAYQWQADVGSGFADLPEVAPYSGVTTPILGIAGATAGLSGVAYRVLVSGSCPPAVASAVATLTVKTVTVAPASLPDATAGTAYSQVLSGGGGAGPYTFAATGLPAWLTLTPGGTLSGNPTTAGPYGFSVTPTDAAGCAGAPRPYSITVQPGPADTIIASGGTPQSAPTNKAFAAALQAVVRDSSGNAVPGVAVTFTAPTSGASGTFPGGVTVATVTTDAAGLAVAPPFTANGIGGSYHVVGSISPPVVPGQGGVRSVAYDLANEVPVLIPTLGGVGAAGLIVLVAGAGLLVLRRLELVG